MLSRRFALLPSPLLVRSPYRLIVPLVAVAAFVVGCGGGSDSPESTPTTTATTTALTKAQLIEQGDAICAEVNVAVGSAEGSAESTTASPAVQAAGLYGGMVASLKNLGTPQESQGYAEFIAAAEALATAEDGVKLASERGDAAGLEAAESNASSALASFQRAADEYGFEKCGEGPTPLSGGTTGEVESGGAEAPESVEPEAAEETPEAVEEAPEVAPEGGGTEGGGGTGGSTGGGSSGGVGPG